ncbi:MAG: hypothetical protein V4629_10425 [Pseudomonadota bacterium]
MSALLTEEYINTKATLGNKDLFIQVMNKVPNVIPEDFDHLSDQSKK